MLVLCNNPFLTHRKIYYLLNTILQSNFLISKEGPNQTFPSLSIKFRPASCRMPAPFMTRNTTELTLKMKALVLVKERLSPNSVRCVCEAKLIGSQLCSISTLFRFSLRKKKKCYLIPIIFLFAMAIYITTILESSLVT